jgi:uncharacterized membrane protein YhaH (DUF805 family)
MATANPYKAPAAAVADSAEQYEDVRFFSASGRIGRARYIAYAIGLWLALMAIVVLSSFLGTLGVVLMVIAYIGALVLGFMLSIQRAHDFNATGWLAILSLVPLINLIFLFIPGTDGENRFGLKTPPNSVGVLVAAWMLPVIFGVGILAAIALPAYQDYVKRAQAKQLQKK